MSDDAPRLTRRRLVASEYGRAQGWDVERDGVVIARLDEPVWEDMFWTSYRIVPVTDDPALAAALLTEAFWRGDGWRRLRFRSRALGVHARGGFPSLTPFVAPGRVNMRGLHVELDPPAGWLARLLDWIRG